MLISEIAEKVGLHPETIRRLEKRGIITPKRDVNGWRRYSPENVQMENTKKLPEDNSPQGVLKKRYAEILADKDYLDPGTTRHKLLHEERRRIREQLNGVRVI